MTPWPDVVTNDIFKPLNLKHFLKNPHDFQVLGHYSQDLYFEICSSGHLLSPTSRLSVSQDMATLLPFPWDYFIVRL